MVAKIKSGKSLIGALNYNEHKVGKGKAELIGASGYFKDLPELDFHDKLLRLTDLAGRNERTKVNAVHISLNFAVGEYLETPVLNQIVNDYMSHIGFGDQPYLVYQHEDAGHPHLHIVTTNIQQSGQRISLNMLGKTKSSEAREAIEIRYGLVKAKDQTTEKKQLRDTMLKEVSYSKMETKRAITNVVNQIVNMYKFTSIPELNAVLSKYNITADRGAKDSRMFEKNGLVYWVLDAQGNKTGVPIKASTIYGKPTLKSLEDRFKLNEVMRKPMKENLKNLIDQALSKQVNKTQFQQMLYAQGVQAVLRHNDEGRLYGVTFIDHRTGSKCVFNGSDLGKEYSANLLASKFIMDSGHMRSVSNLANIKGAHEADAAGHGLDNLLDTLFLEERQDMAAIGKLQQRKRKKKRKGHSL